MSKTCTTSITGGNPLGIEVDISGSITNNTNVQVNNISLVDSPAATFSSVTCVSGCSGSGNGSFTLAPGGVATYTGNYKESGASIVCTPTPDGTSGRCTFTDTVTASGTAAIGGATINSCTPPAKASCSLCPFGTCSTGN